MIHWYDEVRSTQDVALELAEAGAPAGTTVVARTQTGGRGTKGRPWASRLGGLWMSVLLRPAAVPAFEVLSLRVGLALSGLLERLAGRAEWVFLKWPNDLIVADRKLGGILIESRWLGDAGIAIVGVGINVRNELDATVRDLAIRLHDAGLQVPADELAPPVAGAVISASREIGTLTPLEQADFRRRDWLAGKRIEEPIAGVAAGITPLGRLIVRDPRGEAHEVMTPIVVPDLARSNGFG